MLIHSVRPEALQPIQTYMCSGVDSRSWACSSLRPISDNAEMIAGQQLLQNKAHKELLESYSTRAQAACNYMKAVRPGLCIQTGALLDPKVCRLPYHTSF